MFFGLLIWGLFGRGWNICVSFRARFSTFLFLRVGFASPQEPSNAHQRFSDKTPPFSSNTILPFLSEFRQVFFLNKSRRREILFLTSLSLSLSLAFSSDAFTRCCKGNLFHRLLYLFMLLHPMFLSDTLLELSIGRLHSLSYAVS